MHNRSGNLMPANAKTTSPSHPFTISTTKRVNTCLVPSSDSWRVQAKKWSRAPVFVVKGRALHVVAAFHLAVENRKCIL